MEIYRIELTVKKESTSNATESNPATTLTDTYKLMARYNVRILGNEYSYMTEVCTLYTAVETIATGAVVITENTSISSITKSDIDTAVEADATIHDNHIRGTRSINNKLNNILGYSTPYPIENKENVYKAY